MDASSADPPDVLPTWTFEREGAILILQRHPDEQAPALVLTVDGTTRTFSFQDLRALVVFQTDMEAFLMRTRWLLRSYTPDRRKRDRRGFPRTSVDRRRWWTDGIAGAFDSARALRSPKSPRKA